LIDAVSGWKRGPERSRNLFGFTDGPPTSNTARVTLASVSEVPLTNGAGYAVYEVAAANPNDAFARYGLAMELRGAGDLEGAGGLLPATTLELLRTLPVEALAGRAGAMTKGV